MTYDPTPIYKLRDWWDVAFNPTSGCEYLTDECTNCYCPEFHRRHPHYEAPTIHPPVLKIETKLVNGKLIKRASWNSELRSLPDGHHNWDFPLISPGAKHPKLGLGKPSLILVGASGDLFIARRSPKIIDMVVEKIALSNHIGLFCSKYTGPQYRGQMAEYFLKQKPLTVECWRQNMWLGFSAGRQIHFDNRWKDMRPLTEGHGVFVFVSIAPMLERMVLPDDFVALGSRTWVIVNGECEQVGLRRPMEADWARAIRDQCGAAGIPFFMRGMHRGAAIPSDLLIWDFPSV